MSVIDRLGLGPSRKIHEHGDGTVTVTVEPPDWSQCKSTRPEGITLTSDQFDRYTMWKVGGALIQDILSDLSPEDREYLMTGGPFED